MGIPGSLGLRVWGCAARGRGRSGFFHFWRSSGK